MLLGTPRAVFFGLVAVALAMSAVTTLAALLCYDYSLRYDWNAKPMVKLALRRKAHKFGVVGFYGLMWSLAAATALIDPLLSILAAGGIYFVMWCYYFFPKKTVLTLPERVTTSPAANVTQFTATLQGTVDLNHTSPPIFFQWGRSTKYVREAEATLSGTGQLTATAALVGLSPATTGPATVWLPERRLVKTRRSPRHRSGALAFVVCRS